MPEIDDDTTFEVHDDVLTEEVDGEVVVLDLEGDVYFSLNEVGRVVWEGAARGDEFRTIVEAVAEDYEVEVERAREDAAAFLEDVLDRGLMERA